MSVSRETSQKFRAFISLPVAEEVKEKIRLMQNELRQHIPSDAVRWTRPEQIHLTLKFLGNIALEQVDELAAGLQEACDGFGPPTLRAEGFGFFPSRGTPRVLWVSVRDEQEALLRLQSRIKVAMNRIVGSVEEEFKPHLTVGRVKNLSSIHARTLKAFAKNAEGLIFGDWRADVVELMRSELSAEGSRYSTLVEISLKGRG